MRDHLSNQGGLPPKRPDIDRLLGGVGAHDAAGWILHLEAVVEDLKALVRSGQPLTENDPVTIAGMSIDPKAVLRGAAMGLPLSGSATLKLLAHLDEVAERAERAEEVLDSVDTPEFPRLFTAWKEWDDTLMRERTAYPDPNGSLPVEVPALPGVEVSIAVEDPK